MFKLKAFKEVSFLWIGSLLGAVAAFFIQVLTARELGVEEYGLFSAVLAIMALLVPLINFGVSQFWLKVYGNEGWLAQRWLKTSFNFLLLSSLIVSVVYIFLIFIIDSDEFTEKILLWMILFLLGQVFIELVSVRLQLEERFFALASWQFLPHIMRLAFIIVAIYFYTVVNALSIAIIYVVISLFFILFGFFFLLKMQTGQWQLQGHGSKPYLQGDVPRLMTLFSGIWPFGLAAFFHIIYYQSDVILLKYMVGDSAAGYYNVAFSIMAAVYLLPAVIYQKYLLPKMHRWANQDRVKFYQVYLFGNKSMLALGLFAMVGVWLTAFWVIPFLFGDEYNNAIEILNILALSIPLIFLAFNSGATLVTKDNMKKKVKYMGIVALLNLILNFILIPIYQEMGAAIATIFSSFLLMYLYYLGTKRHVFNI